MSTQTGLSIELLWYWQGLVSRYYQNSSEWRSSTELSCWYLRRGHVVLHSDLGKKEASAGSVIIPPPLRRREDFSDDAELYSMRINAFDDEQRMLLYPSEAMIWSGEDYPKLVSSFKETDVLIRNELRVDTSDKIYLHEYELTTLFLLRMRSILANFFQTVLRSSLTSQTLPNDKVAHHPAVVKALNYLSKRELREPLNETDVAEVSGVSLPHLRRLFREQIGVTIKAWDSHRLSASIKRSLGIQRKPCKEIAFEHGFCSPSHFSHWFQLTHGSSPSEWQARSHTDDIV